MVVVEELQNPMHLGTPGSRWSYLPVVVAVVELTAGGGGGGPGSSGP